MNLVGIHQPFIVLVEVVVGGEIDLPAAGLVVGRGDPDIGGDVLSQQYLKAIDHCCNGATGIEHIIDNQEPVVVG